MEVKKITIYKHLKINTMKKVFLALAAAAMIFVGCSKDDDKTIDNLAEKIIGKWITTDIDGHAELTNNKSVITILSATQALISTSRANLPDNQGWVSHLNASVAIDGNKVTITGQLNEHITIVYEITVSSISDTHMEGTFKHSTLRNGEVINTNGPIGMRWEKITTDYEQAVLGKWEGRSTGEDSEFDDGENHRWEYLANGTFRYYRKVDGTWQLSNDEYAKYFVDGNLLCTCWKNNGAGNEEHREWWEISINGDTMNWTALRQREDGTTYTATFQMVKVPANK